MKRISKAMNNVLVETTRATLSYWIDRATTVASLMEGESKLFLFNQVTCEFESICETTLNHNILSPTEVNDHRSRFYDTQLRQTG